MKRHGESIGGNEDKIPLQVYSRAVSFYVGNDKIMNCEERIGPGRARGLCEMNVFIAEEAWHQKTKSQ